MREYVFPVHISLFFVANPTLLMLALSVVLGLLFLVPHSAFRKDFNAGLKVTGDKWKELSSAEENFEKLLEWASDYWQRETPSPYCGHLSLFEQFSGDKICLQSRKAVDDFIASIIGG